MRFYDSLKSLYGKEISSLLPLQILHVTFYFHNYENVFVMLLCFTYVTLNLRQGKRIKRSYISLTLYVNTFLWAVAPIL